MNGISREDYERVVRALFKDNDAVEMLAAYDDGWYGFPVGSPVSLGLAAVSEAYAAKLQTMRPDLVTRIQEMQRDPERALEELRAGLED